MVEFSDNDSRGGWLSGDLILTIPKNMELSKNHESFSEFVLHWGNNPHQLLGMFLPIVTLPKPKEGTKIKIKFKSTRVPPGATHFLLYTINNENGQKNEVFSVPIIDKGVPESKPQKIVFEQIGKLGNRVQGRILLTRAWDERNLSHYAVYWGLGPKTVMRTHPPVIVIEKKTWFGNLISQIQSPWRETTLIKEIDVLMPQEATHIIAFSRNSKGQMNEGVSFKLEGNELEENLPKSRLVLNKKPSPLGIIFGDIILERKIEDSESVDYILFWGKDEHSRLEDLPHITKFQVKKIQDGLIEKEMLVSTLSTMDQKLQVSSKKDGSLDLKYKFSENTLIPKGATHILAYSQKNFWFQDNVERSLKGPIASVSLEDPEGVKKKIKIKSKIKSNIADFSITRFKNKAVKSEDNNFNSEIEIQGNSNNKNQNKSSQEWRISEYRGLGIGLSISGLNGILAFYDYNLDNNQQIHFALDLTGPQVGSLFKTLRLTNESTEMDSIGKSQSGNTLEINRTLFSGIYRWFVDESLVWGVSEGFFYGAGVGIGYATLNYHGRDASGQATISGETESFSSSSTDYAHSTNGMGFFGILDVGWQGLKNYYFQIALQPSFYIYYKDGFKETSIPVNPSQRSTVTDRWSKAKNPSRILLGFGIFF